MRKAPVLATAALAFALSVGTGCNYRPLSSRAATEADLPAGYREHLNLAPDAKVVGVTEEAYGKGTRIYKIRIATADGAERTVKYNPKTTVTPNNVFDATPLEPGVLR